MNSHESGNLLLMFFEAVENFNINAFFINLE